MSRPNGDALEGFVEQPTTMVVHLARSVGGSELHFQG